MSLAPNKIYFIHYVLNRTLIRQAFYSFNCGFFYCVHKASPSGCLISMPANYMSGENKKGQGSQKPCPSEVVIWRLCVRGKCKCACNYLAFAFFFSVLSACFFSSVNAIVISSPAMFLTLIRKGFFLQEIFASQNVFVFLPSSIT